MSRPRKATVDFFPHYVNHGETLFNVESDFGNDGYAFWFKLLEILGRSEHHFYDCNNKKKWKYLLSKTSFSEEDATKILDLLSELESIDKELWQNKIIWSSNFVDNLSKLYSRREVSPLTKPEILGLCIQKHQVNGINVDINPQSKVEESKEEDSPSLQISNLRGRYSTQQLKIIDEYLDILRWTRKSGVIAESVILKIYKEWEKFRPESVIYGLQTYIKNPKYHDKRENYCYGIMRNATAEEITAAGGSEGKYVPKERY